MANSSEESIVATLGKGTVSPWVSATDDGASFGWLQRDRNLGERVVILSIICDAVVIAAAMLFSFWLRFETVIQDYGVVWHVTLRDYAGYAAVGAASMLLTLAYRQFY